MGLGTEMKSLVEDILSSRDLREKAIADIQKDTRHILGEAKTLLREFEKEGQERAEEKKKRKTEVKAFLKGARTFLKSAEKDRKDAFGVTMKTINDSLEDVKRGSHQACQAGKTIVKDARALLTRIAKDNQEQAKDLRENLKKAEQERKGDFKTLMEDIGTDLKNIKQDVSTVRKQARNLVSQSHQSRMRAKGYWASLSSNPKRAKKKTT